MLCNYIHRLCNVTHALPSLTGLGIWISVGKLMVTLDDFMHIGLCTEFSFLVRGSVTVDELCKILSQPEFSDLRTSVEEVRDCCRIFDKLGDNVIQVRFEKKKRLTDILSCK